MTTSQQLSIGFNSATQEQQRLWFGLSLDYRTLFDGLSEDWLPTFGTAGHLLGVSWFATLPARENAEILQTYIVFDPALFPPLDVFVRRSGAWVKGRTVDVLPTDEAVFWPGDLPLFAVCRVLVRTNEERARLKGLAAATSIGLPETSTQSQATSTALDLAPPRTLAAIHLTPEADKLRGATTMAFWAIPRVDEWMHLLGASLIGAPEPLEPLAARLEVKWWAQAPWRPLGWHEHGSGAQGMLWQAAIKVFRDRGMGALDLREAVARIAEEARNAALEPEKANVVRWEHETTRIVRAEETIQRTKWHESPVGCAIQLVLLRPDPARFRTWLDDFPEVPPGTWWSASTLCGLLHGYRGLHPEFRGDTTQRRLLALHAIASSSARHSLAALGVPRERPTISESPHGVGFRWGNLEFATKPETPRRKWMQVDLKVVANERAAEDVARSCRWPCFERELRFADAELLFSSDRPPEIAHGIETTLRFHGEARGRLPANAVIMDRLDVDLFRRCLLIEGGRVSPPPGARIEEQRDAKHRIAPSAPREPARIETPHTQRQGVPPIHGLEYRGGFVGSSEAEKLMADIEREGWRKDLSRRVQHHGWRYDYKARRVTEAMRLGPLPGWAQRLAERLHSEGLVPHVADQVIVNEYVRKQGISEHVDCVPCFADGIAMISLLESWEMLFRRRDVTKRLLLEANSVTVLTREARYEWTHEIRSRVKEPSGLRRQRRVSVTFRKVLLPSN